MEQTFFKGLTVDNISKKLIEVDNKGGNISSDGGLILFSSLDNRLKITEEIAECVTDDRQEGKTLHGMRDLIKQKVLGLIAGYEDQNDHNELRTDGIMKSVLGKEIDLASQATMSRFE